VGRFSAPVQTGSGAHPATYTLGAGSFPGLKRPGRGVDHPSLSSSEVKERIERYLYSPFGPSWHVLGWPLLCLYLYTYATRFGLYLGHHQECQSKNLTKEFLCKFFVLAFLTCSVCVKVISVITINLCCVRPSKCGLFSSKHDGMDVVMWRVNWTTAVRFLTWAEISPCCHVQAVSGVNPGSRRVNTVVLSLGGGCDIKLSDYTGVSRSGMP